MKKIYLDYNATTPVDPQVLEAMLPYLRENFGNPSSLHWAGSKAQQALEESREKVASLLGCEPREIIFTSGGTESNNLAIKGVLGRGGSQTAPTQPAHMITTQIEHSSVLKPFEELENQKLIEVTRLSVDEKGRLNLEELETSIQQNTGLISIMMANNEIGNLYSILEVGNLARKKGILFHTDAVQAVGKMKINLKEMPVDLLSFTGHKFYGPKGVGGLFVRQGVRLSPLISGGAQEWEKRGGTQNLPGIVGMAKALEIANSDSTEEIKKLRDHLQEGLLKAKLGMRVYGDLEHRLDNTLKVSFEGIKDESLLIALDREGIAVSSGSACASGAIEPSHVLQAMGVNRAEAKGSIRFSLGRYTTREEIDSVLAVVPQVVRRLTLTPGPSPAEGRGELKL